LTYFFSYDQRVRHLCTIWMSISYSKGWVGNFSSCWCRIGWGT